MIKLCLFAGFAFLLAACASSTTFPNEAACYAAPFKQGETGYCDYYPGFGWAHVPNRTVIWTN